MTTSNQDWVVQPGTDVYGSDDKKIGEVDDIQNGYLVVRKGFFFPKDHYIPFSAIGAHTEDRINLNVSSDEASSQNWDQMPSADQTTGTTGYATTDTTNTSTRSDMGMGTQAGYTADMGATSGTQDETAPFDHETTNVARQDDGSDHISVPVTQEELTASKQQVERGQVQVTKNVTEREQTLDVPVTEERVHVERRTVDRPADANDISTEGGTIDVPVYGEDVSTQKRARVVEEVDISKDAVQGSQRVSDTVRRQDVNVDETGDVRVDDAATSDRSQSRDRNRR